MDRRIHEWDYIVSHQLQIWGKIFAWSQSSSCSFLLYLEVYIMRKEKIFSFLLLHPTEKFSFLRGLFFFMMGTKRKGGLEMEWACYTYVRCFHNIKESLFRENYTRSTLWMKKVVISIILGLVWWSFCHMFWF